MNQYPIECMVLVSFLESDWYKGIKYFKPDPKIFLHPYNRMVAERIGRVLDSDGSLSLLSVRLEEEAEGNTSRQNNYIEILSHGVLPMTTVKKYHGYLREQYVKRLIK